MTPRGPESAGKGDSEDNRRRELRRLVEIYAIRARELSEAVATLGWHLVAESRFQETLLEVRRLRGLCDKAGSDLLAFLERQEGVPPAGNRL